MSKLLLADYAVTTLASSFASDAGQFTVAPGTGALFPAPIGGTGNYMILTLEDEAGNTEKIKVTHRAGEVFGSSAHPVERGYGGTVARSWAGGDSLSLRWNMSTAQEMAAEAAEGAFAEHIVEADPHPQYAKESEVNAAIAAGTLKVSSTDTTPAQLSTKVTVGALLATEIEALGEDEKLKIKTSMSTKKILGRLSAGTGEFEQLEFTKQTIWVPAVAMYPRLTDGATANTGELATNKVVVKTINFDAAAQQFAQFAVRMPKSWDRGDLTVSFSWSAAGEAGIVWGIQARAIEAGDLLDAEFVAPAVRAIVETETPDTLEFSTESSAVALGTVDADAAYLLFQVFRDVAHASDTYASAARLHGITLHYHVKALTDA